MTETGKRNRGTNWPYEQKLFLLDLIEKRIDVIEDKKTDGKSSMFKQKAWVEILNSFKSVQGIERDIESLKGMWKRLKLAAKAEVRNFRTSMQRTGGGPPVPEPSYISNRIEELLPHEFISHKSAFDDDAENELRTSTPVAPRQNGNIQLVTEVQIHRQEDGHAPTLDFGGSYENNPTLEQRNVNEAVNLATDNAKNSYTEDLRRGLIIDLCSPIQSTSSHDNKRSRKRHLLPDIDEEIVKNQQDKNNIGKHTTVKRCLLEERALQYMDIEHTKKLMFMETEHKERLMYMKEEQKIKMNIYSLQEEVMKRKLNDSSTSYTDLSLHMSTTNAILNGDNY